MIGGMIPSVLQADPCDLKTIGIPVAAELPIIEGLASPAGANQGGIWRSHGRSKSRQRAHPCSSGWRPPQSPYGQPCQSEIDEVKAEMFSIVQPTTPTRSSRSNDCRLSWGRVGA